MKVKITSHFPDEEGNARDPWEGDVPNDLLDRSSNYAVNNSLFRLFNRVEWEDGERLEEWGYRLPSLSMGDRIEHSGLVWVIEGTGYSLVSSTKLEALQVKYDELTRYRHSLVVMLDRTPDGHSNKPHLLSKMDTLGRQIMAVEKEQAEAADWWEMKYHGEAVAHLLRPLPVGYEFRLRDVNRAYSALYRKNQEGTWDQVEGTTAPPHVINMTAEHLGFCVGLTAIAKAVQS